MKTIAILLAAGQGTRMKSDLPKVLHPIAGKPMIVHVLEAVHALNAEKIAIVVGHHSDRVRDAMPAR